MTCYIYVLNQEHCIRISWHYPHSPYSDRCMLLQKSHHNVVNMEPYKMSKNFAPPPLPASHLPHTPSTITTLPNMFAGMLHCTKNTIHQLTTILATSKNALFLGHNHLLTTGADDLTV